MFPRDMVCLRNIGVDTLYTKGNEDVIIMIIIDGDDDVTIMTTVIIIIIIAIRAVSHTRKVLPSEN
jgi:hypothetical protein